MEYLHTKEEKHCSQNFALSVVITSSQCTQAILLCLQVAVIMAKPYVIDTHPVKQPLGNGKGLVLGGKTTPQMYGCLSVCCFGNNYITAEWN